MSLARLHICLRDDKDKSQAILVSIYKIDYMKLGLIAERGGYLYWLPDSVTAFI